MLIRPIYRAFRTFKWLSNIESLLTCSSASKPYSIVFKRGNLTASPFYRGEASFF
nr:MAG TPA: hypothetical protein [Caudoviricetes sp.]